MSDPTAPVPDPNQPAQPPERGADDTAALPPQQPADWAAAPTAAAPAPPAYRAPVAGTPSGPRRAWSEATSTGGGRAALAAAAVLAALFVVAGIGLTAALVVGHHDRGDREVMAGYPGDGRPGMGMGRGNGNGNGNGKGKNGNGNGRPPGQVNPAVPGLPGNGDDGMGMGMGKGQGQGMGQGMGLGRGAGAVLHGEFTTNLTGTPTVMVVQTGQVTAYTAGKSLTVKSTDGYEATYTLTGTAPMTARDGATLGTGVQVQVLAAKDGMKVTALGVG